MNNDIWTELDAVTAHVIDDMMDLLGQEFPETVMSFGIQNHIYIYLVPLEYFREKLCI